MGALFSGFYKCDYQAGDVIGRSVMYASNGSMLGGNSAFAHVGSFEETGAGVHAIIRGQRHHIDPQFKTLYGSDTGVIEVQGTADGARYRFEGGSIEGPGPTFRCVSTPLNEEEFPATGTVGEGAIANGLYSIHLHMLDGIDGGLTGVMLLFDGRILGGDAFFYYLGSYSSANGRWKGQILNQEHTPAKGENPIFGGYEVGIGFSGTCDADGAELEATALAGKRSLRLKAVLKLLQRA